MDYKQKYEQALERAKIINPGTADYEVAVKIFPEIEENEDEKMRKQLLNWFKDCSWDTIDDGNLKREDIIAWLEKQGEQKPTDKVEQKFKVGDWIVNNNGEPRVFRVEKKDWPDCIISSSLGNQFINTFTLDKQYHLWTIQDAKNGDILTDKQNCTCIFREIMTDEGETSVDAYCGITIDNEFVANEKGEIWTVPEDLFPATKEQCTLLFQKMQEAGYEWDAEKKKLKKIEQKPEPYFYCKYGGIISLCSDCKRNHCNSSFKTEEITTWYDPSNSNKQCIDYIQQKPTWSEEDDLNLNQAIHVCHQYGYFGVEFWLKCLRERMEV